MTTEIKSLLRYIAAEIEVLPAVGGTRTMEGLCLELTQHPSLPDANDDDLGALAATIGAIPIDNFEGYSNVGTYQKGLCGVSYSLMRLFGVFNRERLSRLQTELVGLFHDAIAVRSPIGAEPFLDRFFPRFLHLLVSEQSQEELQEFAAWSVQASPQGRHGWICAALQVATRAPQEIGAGIIDELRSAFAPSNPWFHEKTLEAGPQRFRNGYCHPLQFEERKALLVARFGSADQDLSVADRWIVEDCFGATFLFPPCWVWLEFWPSRPWQRLEQRARDLIARNYRDIDAEALQKWLAFAWPGWNRRKADQSVKDLLLAPFTSPELFRF